MEIRRRKKEKVGGRLSDIIISIGGCLFVVFLAALLCLHLFLNTAPAGMTNAMSRPAEDAQYQLNKHRPYRQNRDNNNDNDNDGNDNDNDNDGNDNENDADAEDDDGNYIDPGSMDKPLTRLETSRVKTLRLSRTIETVDSDNLPYDIHRCPPTIPKNYPYAWSILDVLKHWNPHDTEIPNTIHQGLCAIDWSDPTQRKIAVHYRKNEVPFVVKNHPTILRTADRWSDYDYLNEMLGDKAYRNEHSHNSHMMYWKLRGKQRGPLGWKPPTEDVKLSYPDWYEKAKALEDDFEDDPASSANAEHFYLRLNGVKGNVNEWLYDELPFFQPTTQNDIFMVDPSDARGINCRLGSRGTIAETHYDMSRNFILILHGQKRYVLGHPDQCINMELYPQGHPSARHSRIDWTDPESWLHDGRNFRNGMVNEVVLQAGDGLYLPTYWFHFIVSLSLNYQCNARSGISTEEYGEHIRKCGF